MIIETLAIKADLAMNELELTQVVWESTYECISNCLFCYNCWKHEYEKNEVLNINDLQTVIEKLPPFKRFVISGGEPLLRKDLEAIISMVKGYTKNISVLTSGILLNDRTARLLKRHGVFVQVPIHGLENTHNTLTGVEDGYRKAIMGIAWLRKHEVDFAVSTVGNRLNIHELEDVFELGVALGASELQVIRFMPGGEGMKHNDLMLRGNEYMKMLETLNSVCARYGIYGASGAPNIPCVYPLKKNMHIGIGTCGAGMDWIAIDPSGRVRMCNHSPTVLGDLTVQNFQEIWEHPLLQKLRMFEMVPKICKNCEHLRDCMGGCRAVAETYYGSMYEPDPLMVEK